MKDGFKEWTCLAETKELSCSVQCMDLSKSEEQIRMLTHGLASKMLELGIPEIEIDTVTSEILARVNVSPPNTRFIQRSYEKFVVGDSSFTEQELIDAVKNTYPDRLL